MEGDRSLGERRGRLRCSRRLAAAMLGSAIGSIVAGCGGDDTSAAPTSDASSEATIDATASEAATDAAPDVCADAGTPPSTLACAGLYADFASKTISPSVMAYAPAVPLWSDGAGKLRWISLPPNTTIDRTDPNEWTFPIGTKLFKEFTYAGKRVETRLFQKVMADYWVHATYEWNADDSAATISFGDTLNPDSDGGSWVIPTPDQCDSCHRGRSDRVLGFEEVSLGLPSATGLTLSALVAAGLLTPAPTNVNLTVADDGTGEDVGALTWMHVNCGVSCHNANENSEGYGAGMLLRLDPTVLAGTSAPSTWDPLRTTIGVPCVSGTAAGEPRIDPGNPSGSVIAQLVSERGDLQMPPIATRYVDKTDVDSILVWIASMGTDGGIDAGVDAGERMHFDGGSRADAGTYDAAPSDATSTTTPSDAAVDAAEDASLDASAE